MPSKVRGQSISRPTTAGTTFARVPANSSVASRGSASVVESWGSTAAIAAGSSMPATRPPRPSGRKRRNVVIARDVIVAFFASPTTVSGPATAGRATSSIAVWMPSGVTVTGAGVTGSATGAGSSQWSITVVPAVVPSTTWPGTDGTPTGST